MLDFARYQYWKVVEKFVETIEESADIVVEYQLRNELLELILELKIVNHYY